jgi:hypothetical protein
MSFTINSSGNIGLGTINQATTTLTVSGQSAPRPIDIRPVANGYTISIGCQTFVFESLANLLFRIEEYYRNPAEIEAHFMEHKELPNK